MTAYDAGEAFLQVVPSFRGVAEAIDKQAAKWGVSSGKVYAKSFNDQVRRDTNGVPLGPSDQDSTRQGTRTAGKFADGFKARVTAALRSLPDIELRADSSDADARIATLRAKLEELSHQRVGIDVDEATALARIDDIKRQLDELARKDPRVSVRLDTLAASAQLDKLIAEIAAVPDVDVDANTAGASAKLAALKAEADSATSDKDIDVSVITGPALASIGIIRTALLALSAGALITPLVAGAASLLGPLAAGIGGIAGVGAASIPGISRVTGALQAQKTASSSGGGPSAASVALQQASATAQVTSAEEQLANAQRASLAAQKALTDAREQARRSLVDQANSVKDANLQLQADQLAVTQAQQNAAAVNANSTSTDMQKKQAALALAQAQQQLAEQQITVKRTTEDNTKAQKAGVAGSAQVVQAQQQVRSSARQVTDAQRSLKIAHLSAAAAADTGAQSTDKLGQAMAKLTPQEHILLASVQKFKAAFTGWATALEPDVFPVLTGGMSLLARLLPVVTPLVEATATALGHVETMLGRAFAGADFQKFVATLSSLTGPALTGAARIVINLGRAFAGLTEATAPLAGAVGGGLITLTSQLAKAANGPGLKTFARIMASLGPQLVHTLGSVGGLVANAFATLAPLAKPVLSVVDQLARSLSSVLKAVGPALTKLFAALAPAVDALITALGPGLTVLVRALASGLAILAPVLGPIGKLISAIVTALAPLLPLLAQLIAAVLPPIAHLFTAVAQALQPVITQLVSALQPVIPVLTKALIDLVNALIPILPQLADLLIAVIPLIPSLVKLAAQILEIAVKLLPLLIPVLKLIAWVLNNVGVPAVNFLIHVLGDLVNWIGDVFGWLAKMPDHFRGAAKGIMDAFGAVKGFFKGLWGDVEHIFSDAVNFLTQKVLNPLIGLLDHVLGVFGVHIAKIPAIHIGGGGKANGTPAGPAAHGGTFAGGGVLPGYAPGVDSVHVLASPGEGMIVPEAVRGLGGPPAIQALNAMFSPRVSGRFSIGGVVGGVVGAAGGAVHAVTGAVSGVVGTVTDAIRRGAADVAIAALKTAEEPIKAVLGLAPGQFGKTLANGVFDKINSAVFGFIRGQSTLSGGLVGAPLPVGQHAALIRQALGLAGVADTAGNEGAVNVIVSHESGWNPNAINLTDSNAAAGDPSRGLMQTIMTTFEAYRLRGLPDNIYDPLANLAAGIRYAVSRYGSLGNVPGVAAVSHGQPYVGYDAGGFLPPGLTTVFNGTGRPEPVFTSKQFEQLANGTKRNGMVNHWDISTMDPEAAAATAVRKLSFVLGG